MPNWCMNEVSMSGRKSDMEDSLLNTVNKIQTAKSVSFLIRKDLACR